MGLVIFIICLVVSVPWGIIYYILTHKDKTVKESIRIAFRQGNHHGRRMLLSAMVETVENEYTEDNWYSRLYWLVEELLKADNLVGKFPIDEGRVAVGLRVAVHDAIRYKEGIVK